MITVNLPFIFQSVSDDHLWPETHVHCIRSIGFTRWQCFFFRDIHFLDINNLKKIACLFHSKADYICKTSGWINICCLRLPIIFNDSSITCLYQHSMPISIESRFSVHHLEWRKERETNKLRIDVNVDHISIRK